MKCWLCTCVQTHITHQTKMLQIIAEAIRQRPSARIAHSLKGSFFVGCSNQKMAQVGLLNERLINGVCRNVGSAAARWIATSSADG